MPRKDANRAKGSRTPEEKGRLYHVDLPREMDEIFERRAAYYGLYSREYAVALVFVDIEALPADFFDEPDGQGGGYSGETRRSMIAAVKAAVREGQIARGERKPTGGIRVAGSKSWVGGQSNMVGSPHTWTEVLMKAEAQQERRRAKLLALELGVPVDQIRTPEDEREGTEDGYLITDEEIDERLRIKSLDKNGGMRAKRILNARNKQKVRELRDFEDRIRMNMNLTYKEKERYQWLLTRVGKAEPR